MHRNGNILLMRNFYNTKKINFNNDETIIKNNLVSILF